jgi:hypothetical protein
MTIAVARLVRWLAFQLGEPEPEPKRPACITFYGNGG